MCPDWDRTRNPGVLGRLSNQLSYPARGTLVLLKIKVLGKKFLGILLEFLKDTWQLHTFIPAPSTQLEKTTTDDSRSYSNYFTRWLFQNAPALENWV